MTSEGLFFRRTARRSELDRPRRGTSAPPLITVHGAIESPHALPQSTSAAGFDCAVGGPGQSALPESIADSNQLQTRKDKYWQKAKGPVAWP